MSETAHRLLVDLDAIIDTRFGTIIGLNKAAAAPIVESGYHARMLDDFEKLSGGLIKNDEYRAAYAKRDIETLKRSIMTGIPTIINAQVETLSERKMRGVDVTQVIVTINTWPYTLPGPLLQMYKKVVEAVLPPFVDVEVTKINYADLDPLRLRAEYDGWCTYEFDSWFTLHYESLLFNHCNQVSVILPRIHLKDPEEVKPDVGNDKVSPLDMLALHSAILEDFIHLEYLPVVDFSFYHPGVYTESPPNEKPSSEVSFAESISESISEALRSSSPSGSSTKSP